MLDNVDDLCGTLRDNGSDRHCLGRSAIEPNELIAAREVGLNPFNDSSGDAVVVLEPTEQDLMVERVERGAEVKQAKKCYVASIGRLIRVEHDLDCRSLN